MLEKYLGCENFNFMFIPTKYLSCYYMQRSFNTNESIIFHKITSILRNTEILSFSRRILYVRKERSSDSTVAAGLVTKIVTDGSKSGRAKNCCTVIVPRRETNTHPESSRIFSIPSGCCDQPCGRKRYIIV